MPHHKLMSSTNNISHKAHPALCCYGDTQSDAKNSKLGAVYIKLYHNKTIAFLCCRAILEQYSWLVISVQCALVRIDLLYH